MQRIQWFLEARPCLEVGYDPLNTACSHCSRTVNVNKTWSNSIDAVFRNRNMGAMCLVLCIVSLLAVQRSSRVLLVQVTWDSQNGSQKVGRAIPNTTYCWVSVSKERGPGSNSLWPAKRGRRLTNSEVMEYDSNWEEDQVIQESPHMKCGNIRKTEASGNYGKRSELGRQKHPETSECESETSGTDGTGNEPRRRREKPEMSEDGRQKHPEMIGYE